MPYMLLVETLSTGRMIPRISSWVRHVTSVMLFALAVGAAVYGVSYAYLLHHGVNVLCVWLIGVHLSGGELCGVLRRFGNLGVGASVGESHEKKQP